MAIVKIETESEFNEILQQNSKLLFLKNSTTCPISHAAFEEFTSFAQFLEDITFYYLNVQEARPLSNEIASRFKVKHESPQALLFKDGEVVWNDSHWNITNEKLQTVWDEK
ncbi:bacillithiol system redox-active protein YtxJ [Bacillus alkalicellulosilyticus]|uniref:bacillithiol system redox-active protein YtxJ n=1 Tax=Alkalihalobacterium alkalicellulosilyticum TaxID=1912214 RepID=UPI0009961758|nr:bacillithiol system redox-active protein YtxJ [Bacillus alkalicellulosilyticus]